MARDDKGKRVASIHDGAVTKLCLYGALAKATYEGTTDERCDLQHSTLLVVKEALEQGPEGSIVTFNDKHTHEEVLNLLDKAITISQTTGIPQETIKPIKKVKKK